MNALHHKNCMKSLRICMSIVISKRYYLQYNITCIKNQGCNRDIVYWGDKN